MRAYIRQLIELGVPIEYFVEGGRSRTGRLLQPKLGMLDMTVDAYIKTQARPLAFVSIAAPRLVLAATTPQGKSGVPPQRSLRKSHRQFWKTHHTWRISEPGRASMAEQD